MFFNTIILPGGFPIVNLPRVIHYLSEYYGLKLHLSDIRQEDVDVEVELSTEQYTSSEFHVHGNEIKTMIFHEKKGDGNGYVLKTSEEPETIIEMKDNDGFHYQ